MSIEFAKISHIGPEFWNEELSFADEQCEFCCNFSSNPVSLCHENFRNINGAELPLVLNNMAFILACALLIFWKTI